MQKIPKKLQAVLWSAKIDELDLSKHKGYIIHQILQYGTMEDIHWLFENYPKTEIRRVFLTKPIKTYTKESFYFAKNFLLGIKGIHLDQDDYITSISVPVRPRASGSF